MSKRKLYLVAGVLLILLIAVAGKGASSRKTSTVSRSGTKSSKVTAGNSGYYMYVKSEGLNVRKQPDADSAIVFVLQQNDKLVTDKVSHNGWYKVSSLDESATGYVNASYLSDTPLTEAEIAIQRAQAKEAAMKAEQAAAKSAAAGAAAAEEQDPTSGPPRATLTKREKSDSAQP